LISTSAPLPYSLLSIQPLPPSLGIGSVLLTSANGLLLLDIQGGKLVGCPSNNWLERDFPPGRPLPLGVDRDPTSLGKNYVNEVLEGSIVQFLASPTDETSRGKSMDNQALVFCRSGKVLTLSIERIGRSISGMKMEVMEGVRREGGVSCSVRLEGIDGGVRVFVGGEQEGSKLFEVLSGGMGGGMRLKEEEKVKVLEVKAAAEQEEDEEMDEDDEGSFLLGLSP